MKTVTEREGKLEDLDKAAKDGTRQTNLQSTILNPISLGFFGGVLNFNKMNIIFRRSLWFHQTSDWKRMALKKSQPGVL